MLVLIYPVKERNRTFIASYPMVVSRDVMSLMSLLVTKLCDPLTNEFSDLLSIDTHDIRHYKRRKLKKKIIMRPEYHEQCVETDKLRCPLAPHTVSGIQGI